MDEEDAEQFFFLLDFERKLLHDAKERWEALSWFGKLKHYLCTQSWGSVF